MSLVNPSQIKDDPVAEADKLKTLVQESELDDYGRRHWKVSQVQKIAGTSGGDVGEGSESDEENSEDIADVGPRTTSHLLKRNKDLLLDMPVDKRRVITADMPKQQSSVYYCPLCEVSCNDSQTWLDHLNGKKHNRLLGMNMKVERVEVSRVREKFNSLKKMERRPIEDFQEFEKKYDESQKKKNIKIKEKQKQKNDQELVQFQQEALRSEGSQNLPGQIKEQVVLPQEQEVETELDQVDQLPQILQNQSQVSNIEQSNKNQLMPENNNSINQGDSQQQTALNNSKQVNQQEILVKEEDSDDEDTKLMKQMGLPVNFGGSKKKR